MTKKKKIAGGSRQITAEIHPELYYLVDRISRLYKLHNGKTALYWHLVTVINEHLQKDNIQRLQK